VSGGIGAWLARKQASKQGIVRLSNPEQAFVGPSSKGTALQLMKERMTRDFFVEQPGTREEAIEWLSVRGVHAIAWDWSFGKSIVALAGESEPVYGPGSWRWAVCIFPWKSGWSVQELGTMPPTLPLFRGSLVEALNEAVRALNTKTAAGRAAPDESSCTSDSGN